MPESDPSREFDEPARADEVVSATEAQNHFGRVLNRVLRDGAVFITKYDEPTAVILSIDEYRTLTRSRSVALDALTDEFDSLLARMQSDDAAAAVDALFAMEPSELGEAARRGARPAADRSRSPD